MLNDYSIVRTTDESRGPNLLGIGPAPCSAESYGLADDWLLQVEPASWLAHLAAHQGAASGGRWVWWVDGEWMDRFYPERLVETRCDMGCRALMNC